MLLDILAWNRIMIPTATIIALSPMITRSFKGIFLVDENVPKSKKDKTVGKIGHLR